MISMISFQNKEQMMSEVIIRNAKLEDATIPTRVRFIAELHLTGAWKQLCMCVKTRESLGLENLNDGMIWFGWKSTLEDIH